MSTFKELQQRIWLPTQNGMHISDNQGVQRQIVSHDNKNNVIRTEYLKSYSGRDKLYDQIKQKYVGISKRDIEKFLKGNVPHQLTSRNTSRHASSTKNISIRPIIPQRPNNIWAIDLADYQIYSRSNSFVKYLFVCVDMFSKYLWVVPMKNKNPQSAVNALKHVVRISDLKPRAILSDNGAEFIGNTFKNYLSENSIKRISLTPGTPQGNLAESYVRLVKTRVQRHLTYTNKKKYIDVLPGIVSSYNAQKHSTTGQRPIDVVKTNSESVINGVRERIISRATSSKYANDIPPLKVGDKVRLSHFVFENVRNNALVRKGINENWTRRVYTILQVKKPRLSTNAYQYKVMFQGRNRLLTRDQLQLVGDIPTTLNVREPERFNIVPSNAIVPPTSLSERNESTRRNVRRPNRFL